MASERTAPQRPPLAAAAAAAIAAVCFGVYSCTPASLLRVFAEPSCSDAGPWPCEEEGCPSPSLGCADLVELGVCRKAFSDIYTTPPANAAGRTAQSKSRATWPGQPAGPVQNRGAACQHAGRPTCSACWPPHMLWRPTACSGAERACTYRLVCGAGRTVESLCPRACGRCPPPAAGGRPAATMETALGEEEALEPRQERALAAARDWVRPAGASSTPSSTRRVPPPPHVLTALSEAAWRRSHLALELLREIAAQGGGGPELLSALATACARRGLLEEAARHFEAAAEIAPDSVMRLVKHRLHNLELISGRSPAPTHEALPEAPPEIDAFDEDDDDEEEEVAAPGAADEADRCRLAALALDADAAAVVAHLNGLHASGVDAEIALLCRGGHDEAGLALLEAFSKVLAAALAGHANFDALQAYVHRLLQHHAAPLSLPRLKPAVAKLAAAQRDAAARFRALVHENLCLLDHASANP